jgi:hypothetical protein
MKSSYDARDIAFGGVHPSKLKQKFIIIYDRRRGENFASAINILAENGWIVKQCWGTGSLFYGLFENTNHQDEYFSP